MLNRLGGYVELTGTFNMTLPGNNIVLWSGMSEPFVDAMASLAGDGRIHFRETQWLIYCLDGGALQLPVVKRRPPRGGFKTAHWLPVCIGLGKRRGVHPARGHARA